MGVTPGSPVSAVNTNAAFIDANNDDETLGRLGLNNALSVSGSQVTNAQRELNSEASFTGKSLNSVKDDKPSYSNNEGFSSNQDLKTRVDAISEKFKSVAGHAHTGAAGDGAPIDSGDIANVILKGIALQATTLTAVTGTSKNVSTEMSGKTASHANTTKGVVTNAPYNKIILRDTNADEIVTPTGDTVYGRLTESTGTWTLSFYYLLAGVETAYNILVGIDIDWYYQELINVIADAGYVYSPIFSIPSDNATADVVDASATQRGVVSTSAQSFAGLKTLKAGSIDEVLKRFKQQVDAGTTGAAATVALSQVYTAFTNGSLSSIAMISSPADAQIFIWTNKTGVPFQILNDTGATASLRILTGTGLDMTVDADATVWGIYNTNATRWQIIGGSGSGGGASLPINYLPKGNAEGANPFVMYADGAAQPVDGTGGSPSATITQTSSAPLRGAKSFLFTSGGIGDGGAYDFTLEVADKSSIVVLELDSDGAFVAGDLSVWLYDVTNSLLIAAMPTPNLQPLAGKQKIFFQTGVGTSYRFLIHQASANSFTAKFELSLQASPTVGFAPITTDWAVYTPIFTASWGSTSNISFLYRRLGDTLEVKGSLTAGAVTGAIGSLTLPPGLVIDPSKSSISNTTGASGPLVGCFGANGGNNYGTMVTAITTSATLVYMGHNTTGGNMLIPNNMNAIIAPNVDVGVHFTVPILGWSASSQIVSEYDGRVIAAKAYGLPTGGNGAGVAFIWPSVEFDTHGNMYNASTGEFTAKATGIHDIQVNINSSNAAAIFPYVNGVQGHVLGYIASNGSVSGSVRLNIGDVLTIRPDGSMAAFGANCQVSVSLRSGAQQLLPGQKIEAKYNVAANVSITANVTPINFATKVYDTVDMVTTGVGTWKVKVPVTGSYLFIIKIVCDASTAQFAFYKNGVLAPEGYFGAADPNGQLISSEVLQLIGQDEIEIRSSSTRTIYGTTNNAAWYSSITIKQTN